MSPSVREWREQMRHDLEGWTEPTYDPATNHQVRAGYLYCTEPDAAARALTRIELRVAIATLTRVLGEPAEDIEAAQHRDRMRIADDAVENYELARTA